MGAKVGGLLILGGVRREGKTKTLAYLHFSNSFGSSGRHCITLLNRRWWLLPVPFRLQRKRMEVSWMLWFTMWTSYWSWEMC